MSQTAIDPTLDLFEEIERLKRERKAVILAHYYQDPDIQDVADHLVTRWTSRRRRVTRKTPK